MNLLTYNKKISEKINFYDNILKPRNFDVNMSNPFYKPLNVTILWVENSNK